MKFKNCMENVKEIIISWIKKLSNCHKNYKIAKKLKDK